MENSIKTEQSNAGTTVHKIFGKGSCAAIRSIWAAILMCMMICALNISVLAAPKIKHVSYEGNRKIEVDFKGRVQYKNVKVTVKDPAGKKITAVIRDRDRDDLEFTIKKAQPGKTYTFTISGIRGYGEKNFSKVSGRIYIPKHSGVVPVKSVEYDDKDREVEFEFSSAVQWKSAKVTITSGKKHYQIRITEKNRKELEVKVRRLKKGTIYRYQITGIRRYNDKKYVTITGTFMA